MNKTTRGGNIMAMKIQDGQGSLATFPKVLVIVAFVVSFLDLFIAAFLIWQGTLDIEYAAFSMIVGVVILFAAVVAVGSAVLLKRSPSAARLVVALIPTVFLLLASYLILADFTVLALGE